MVYGTTDVVSSKPSYRRSFAFPLEQCGLDGEKYTHTSNRAELRAAAAALKYRLRSVEGWDHLAIATDSEYVVDGITNGFVNWQKRDWQESAGEDVPNKDLWNLLLHLVNGQAYEGCEVTFLHI